MAILKRTIIFEDDLVNGTATSVSYTHLRAHET